jgi:hypothetical protein
MKNLTDAEQTLVSGGNSILGALATYVGEKLIEAAIKSALEKEDLFQDTDMRLPYNRL